ncbi:MAG: UDP-N-acetylmuramoyl-tripeptide--D-alanyl-D-alanine ligase [Myxococcota bacterium]
MQRNPQRGMEDQAPTLFPFPFIRNALRERGLRIVGQPPTENLSIGIDSRDVRPTDLFVALVGERFDGHDFAKAALRSGAQGAVIRHGRERDLEGVRGVKLLVDDPLLALHDLARAHVRRLPAVRIGITGSVGKTTTKEFVRAALCACLGQERVLATAGTRNNHIGLPLCALQAGPRHRALVFEMGMNHAGEIATLADIARPRVGLITHIGLSHQGFLGGVAGVAKAKAELFAALNSDGTAITNRDNGWCVRVLRQAPTRSRLTFGWHPQAHVRVVHVSQQLEGLERGQRSGCSTLDSRLRGNDKEVDTALQASGIVRSQSPCEAAVGQWITLARGKEHRRVWIPALGEHQAGNAAAAVAVATALGLDFTDACRGLGNVRPVAGRLRLLRLRQGGLLLDDTYNASPESFAAALAVLVRLPAPRRLAFLGEMRELGDQAAKLHRAVGKACARHGVTGLFVCGRHAREYIRGARDEGMPSGYCRHFEDSKTLAGAAASLVRPDDALLVKGSRGMRMERVVQALCGARK